MAILKMFLPNGKIDVQYYRKKFAEELMKTVTLNTWIVPANSGVGTVELEGGMIPYKGPAPTLYTK